MVCVCSTMLWLSWAASAELINVDFEGDPPNDTTHSGADGVLSGGGAVWNGIETGVDASALLDESGATTVVDILFSSSGGGVTDASATNDLQDSGTLRMFNVEGLDSGTLYDVAVYAHPFSLISFTDSTGVSGGLCTASPTYLLPGTLAADYCLYEDRTPADLGGGEYGFTVAGIDGVVMAMQILGQAGEPAAVPALSAHGIAGLLLGLLAVGAGSTRSARTRRP